jgi:hypothetical protein
MSTTVDKNTSTNTKTTYRSLSAQRVSERTVLATIRFGDTARLMGIESEATLLVERKMSQNWKILFQICLFAVNINVTTTYTYILF